MPPGEGARLDAVAMLACAVARSSSMLGHSGGRIWIPLDHHLDAVADHPHVAQPLAIPAQGLDPVGAVRVQIPEHPRLHVGCDGDGVHPDAAHGVPRMLPAAPRSSYMDSYPAAAPSRAARRWRSSTSRGNAVGGNRPWVARAIDLSRRAS